MDYTYITSLSLLVQTTHIQASTLLCLGAFCATRGEYGFHHIALERHIVLDVVGLQWVQLQQCHLAHMHVVVFGQDAGVDALLDEI